MKSFTVLSLAGLLAGGLHAGKPLENFLPDSTLGVVSFEDAPALVEALEGGVLAGMLAEQESDGWWAKREEPFTLGNGETYTLASGEELSLVNLTELLDGRVLGAVVSVSNTDEVAPDIVLMAEFNGDVDALRFLQLLDRGEDSEDVLLIEEEYAGQTLYLEELNSDDEGWMTEYWALVDGIAIETSTLESLKNTVDAILDGEASASLASSPDYRRGLDLTGENQVRIFLNFSTGELLLREYLERDMGAMPVNPLGVTFDSLWSSLELDMLDCAMGGLDLEGEHISTTFALLYEERRGVLRLLSYSGEPVEYPHWIPAEAVDSTVSTIAFSETFAAFEDIMNGMSQNFGALLQLQLDNFRQQSGIDLRESLINNFGDELVTFSVLRPGAGSAAADPMSSELGLEDTIIAIPVKDPVAFQSAIKGLAETFLPGMELLQEKEFMDFTIYTPAMGGAGDDSFGYAFANGYLVLGTGSVELLERTLYRMREASDGLWDERALVEGLAELPDGAVESTYYDFGKALETIIEAFRSEWAQGTFDDFGGIAAPDIPEDFSLPYFMISSTYLMDGAQVTHGLVLPKED
ncbi:MAG: hypothetical protein ACQKBV_01890 [Puniceicoccales bacterium]